jgi:hypothetical protein
MTLLISLLGLLSCPVASLSGQDGAPRPGKTDTVKVWQAGADKIAADPLGQFYLVSDGGLVKYDAQGDSAFSWSEPQTGQITLIETSDPMRILVYQKDFNLLRFLNNRLAVLSGTIRLDDLGIVAPLTFAVARQGGFWVLDGSTFRISQIDLQLKTRVESMPLNLSSGANLSVYRMLESGDQLLLQISGKEILVFDLFANLIKKIPAKATSFNVYGDRILLVYPDRISLWKDPVTPEETLLFRPGADIREACFVQNRLLVRTTDKVLLIIP